MRRLTSLLTFMLLGSTAFALPVAVEDGFVVKGYATKASTGHAFAGPTSLAYDPQGRLWVTERGEASGASGRVSIVEDTDDDGVADQVIVFLEGLDEPLGIAFQAERVFVATKAKVTSYLYDGDVPADPFELISDLPSADLGDEIAWHGNNNLVFGPDGKLYFGVGSRSNLGDPVIEQELNATVMRYDSDGSNGEIYSFGLRNAFDVAFHPVDGSLWCTENAYNTELLDPLPVHPVDELNVLVPGGDYGFPGCHGESGGDDCEGTIAPAAELPSHSSANGMAFYTGDQFPAEYRNSLFVAEFGALRNYARNVGNGRRVSRYEVLSGEQGYQVTRHAAVIGLVGPVDVAQSPDGSMMIADHAAGVIYRLDYVAEAEAIDDTSPRVSYGTIGARSDDGASGRSYRYSATAGDGLRFVNTLPATSIGLTTYKGPDQGLVELFLDGENVGVVDLYSPTPQWGHEIVYDGLPFATHSIIARIVGQPGPESSGAEVRFDGFLEGTLPLEEDTVGAQYFYWIGLGSPWTMGDTYRVSESPNHPVRFTFSGTQFRWITAKGPKYGRADIYVDGELHSQNVDLFAPGQVWQHEVTVGGLADGEHEVSIVPQGAVPGFVNRPFVVFDGVKIP